MENRMIVLQNILARLEQDVDFITKYIHIVQEDTLHIPMRTQSEDQVVDTAVETVSFMDEETGDRAGLMTTDTAFIGDDQVDEASLSKFLSRPVRIGSTTWSETDSSSAVKMTLDPWLQFFSDPRIKRKLDNFAFLRANLKIKVVVNASPFYHGFALCSYQPLPNFTPSTLSSVTNLNRMQLSQRPHLWINPQDNQAGEMTLPFLWPKNWVSVKNAQEFRDLGSLDVRAFTELRSANGTVGTGVTIQIFAWAEDVKLSGSTLSMSLQSKDEYGTGPISGPASALANVAAALEPKFGRFATATRMVASTTAGVAKLFGFTNVPVIEEAKPVRISQYANFASPEIGYPVNKLTLDAKNELSVDPTILGLPNEDELAIKHIVTKQSYYYQFTWDSTDIVDTPLTYQNVTPMMVDASTTGPVTTYVHTPPGYVAGLFQAWRGDIKVTFRFAATKYHKGRVRITYDPQGDATNNVTSVADGSSGAYTIFADLSDSLEVSMVIPFQQALPYLRTSATSLPGRCYDTSASPIFNMDSALHNGAFCVRVATVLSAPVATSTVDVLVLVQGCDNLEFANPARIDPRLSPFTPQSVDEVLGTQEATLEEKRGLMNYGETVRSLRVLMRRATPTMPFVFVVTTAGLRHYVTVNRKIPPYPGFDPGAIYSGIGKVVVSPFPYTWAAMSVMQYVNLAYIGYRGSTIWHYVPKYGVTSAANATFRVTRRNDTAGLLESSVTVNALSATNSSANALTVLQEYGHAGTIIAPISVASGTAVSIPNQARYLFQSTNPRNATAGGSVDDSQYDAVYTEADLDSTHAANTATSSLPRVDAYCSAGTDYTCIFFLNTPALYATTTVIPA